jgi:hypothetical protein
VEIAVQNLSGSCAFAPFCTRSIVQVYRHMRRSGDQVLGGCDCCGEQNRPVSATEVV